MQKTFALILHANTSNGAVCSAYSARSRVRGHLEVYHAYLRDNTIPIEFPEERGIDDEWEMLNGEERLSNTVSKRLIMHLKYSLI